MSKIRLLRKCELLLLLMCMAQMIDYSAESVLATLDQEIQPMADSYEWKYKTTNGKRYRRLYNVTKHSWVGDWIPV